MFRKQFRFLALVLLIVFGQLAGTAANPSTSDPTSVQMLDSRQFLERAINHPPAADHEKEINELISRMTLQEKVGQMTQLDIAMITDGKNQEIAINPAKLEKAVVQYGAGSILNVFDEALTPERWHEIIGAIQAANAKTRLKIPVLYGLDSIHGANYIQRSTLFPQPLGMAATWNPELALRAAQITADETRAAGVPWNFSPVLDVGRQPLWPRLWETYGEDTHLVSVMGVAMVRGYEGNDVSDPHQVAASLKHYVGYSAPNSGRDRTPGFIPENTLRDFYLPPFAAAVKAGAQTVMVNSSEVNGIPGHVNHYLLTDVLRDELHFQGLVVSDWEDIKKLVTAHHVAANEKDATRMSVMAGIDMSMVPRDYSFPDLVIQMVKEGSIPLSRIDEAVRRILRVKYALGLFNGQPKMDATMAARVGTPENRKVSLAAARESITLLQNKNSLLPLKPGTRILLTGPTADTMVSLNNGWSYTWQGDQTNRFATDFPTFRKALEQRAGAQNVTYVPGTSFDKEISISAAAKAAAKADVVVLALGEASYAETPGNIPDLALSQAQIDLARAMIATKKPVIAVLIEGRPRLISTFADNVSSILMAYNPGNMGGQAIAEILFGDVNPSGHLPITYPRSSNALLTYDRKAFEDEDTAFDLPEFKPQFEFGRGLSYTTFAYSDLKVSPASVKADDPVTVSVKVTNTGKRAGKEVVQVYLKDVVALPTPPGKRLVRFAKINLQPGESQTLSFTLDSKDMSLTGTDNKPVAEPGDFIVKVADLQAGFNLLSSGN